MRALGTAHANALIALAIVLASGAAMADPAPAPQAGSSAPAAASAPAEPSASSATALPALPANGAPSGGAAVAKPAPKPAPKAAAKPAKPSPTQYPKYVKNWHSPVPNRTTPLDENGRPKLVLVSLNTNDHIELVAANDHGGFAASDLDRAAYVLRDSRTGNQHPMEPRELDVVYRIQTHFQAQEIRVISGYRTPHGSGSNHGRGRAIDLVVPGVNDQEVAKFARELGFVGVGIYPHAGFVHVDVRDRSYFWVDASGPGRKNRERGILGDLAARSDAQAIARGEHKVSPLLIAFDVDAALRARTTSAAPPSPDEDDDDDDDTPPSGG